ncbi:MAG: carboxymuconolactone decarboxylase family protein [Planctomycetes bacterium]|nr:carboxymuconolactone decarboxylase family protein [Planctomycetota bacterium]
MSIERLLRRPGLEPRVRLLVTGLVAIWRADWPTLGAAAKAAQDRSLPRADLEEMLLQSVLFCGFPRAVTAFEQLGEVWPAASPPTGGALPAAEQGAAGRQLFSAIYGRNAAAVDAMLAGFHNEFRSFVLDVAYGRILTRPGLSGHDRELLAVAALAASDQRRQFAGHARGALHLGATRTVLREVLTTVFTDESTVEAWCQRIPSPDATPTEGPGGQGKS